MADIKVENSRRTPPKIEKTPTVNALSLREEAANGFFQMAGLGCIMFGQYADAGAVSVHGPNISAVAAKMAETNELIAKGLDSLLTVGPYAELIAVTLPFVMQLLANHKVLPADKLSGANVVAPETLEAQVKTQMARQAMEAIKMQRAAEQEMAMMREEMMAESAQNGASPAE